VTNFVPLLFGKLKPEFVRQDVVGHEVDEVDVADVALGFEESGHFAVLDDADVNHHVARNAFKFAFLLLDEISRLENLLDFGYYRLGDGFLIGQSRPLGKAD
jgi:hypothetical protein